MSARAESHGSGASLTTIVPGGSEAAREIERAAVRAALKERAEAEKAAEKGEVAIDFAPEQKAVRYADLFRRKSSGDVAAAREWEKLKAGDRVLALARVLSFSPLPLRKKALAEIADLSREDDPEGEALPAVIEAAIQDPDADVRNQATQQMVRQADERIARLLIRNFRKRGPIEQRRVVDALKAMGGPKVLKVVIEHWRDMWGPGPRAHMFVARQQSYVADYEISGDSYDPVVRQFLVGVVLDVKSLLAYADIYLVKILREMTGRNHGNDLQAWRRWWKEEQRKAALAQEAGVAPAGKEAGNALPGPGK
jgi:hypothetical protein